MDVDMYDDDDGGGLARAPASAATPTAHRPEQRATRSTTGALKSNKPPPKLKLKLGDKSGPYASGTSFLGSYDRELDSDAEDDLVFEEQFILRVPRGEAAKRIQKLAHDREAAPDVWFKFRDSRRGVFNIGNTTFNAKLVDLPCIIEAQKTLDKKQLFKVADISQMLVLSHDDEHREGFNVDEFIWPHGVTPPLKHVRKRRFRKRVNRRTIETVEQEVERLFEADAAADSVQFTVLESVNPDLSDSEFIERDDFGLDNDGDGPTPAGADAPTPMGDGDDDVGEDDEDALDAAFAAELQREMEEGSSGEEGDDSDASDEEEEEGEDDDDEEGEDDEFEHDRKRFNVEIRDLEAAIAKKHSEIAASANPLVKKRFEDQLRKMVSELEAKQGHREDLMEKRARAKELKARAEQGEAVDVDVEGDESASDGEEADNEVDADAAVVVPVYDAQQPIDEDDDLFGGPGEP